MQSNFWPRYLARIHCLHADAASVRLCAVTLVFSPVITCSAVALTIVLWTSLVPYGNMETLTPHSSKTSQVIMMKLRTFDYVRETNMHMCQVWLESAR